jgi:hypothetical protein
LQRLEATGTPESVRDRHDGDRAGAAWGMLSLPFRDQVRVAMKHSGGPPAVPFYQPEQAGKGVEGAKREEADFRRPPPVAPRRGRGAHAQRGAAELASPEGSRLAWHPWQHRADHLEEPGVRGSGDRVLGVSAEDREPFLADTRQDVVRGVLPLASGVAEGGRPRGGPGASSPHPPGNPARGGGPPVSHTGPPSGNPVALPAGSLAANCSLQGGSGGYGEERHRRGRESPTGGRKKLRKSLVDCLPEGDRVVTLLPFLALALKAEQLAAQAAGTGAYAPRPIVRTGGSKGSGGSGASKPRNLTAERTFFDKTLPGAVSYAKTKDARGNYPSYAQVVQKYGEAAASSARALSLNKGYLTPLAARNIHAKGYQVGNRFKVRNMPPGFKLGLSPTDQWWMK